MLKKLKSLFGGKEERSYDRASITRVYAAPEPEDEDIDAGLEDIFEYDRSDYRNSEPPMAPVYASPRMMQRSGEEEYYGPSEQHARMELVYAPPEVMFGEDYRRRRPMQYPDVYSEEDDLDEADPDTLPGDDSYRSSNTGYGDSSCETSMADVYACPYPLDED